jgi:hypothetical protein
MKIEELISDLTDRYSKGALHVQAALQGAKVAIDHLKGAVTSQAAPEPAKKAHSKSPKRKKAVAKKVAAKAPKAKKKLKKTASKKSAPQTPSVPD